MCVLNKVLYSKSVTNQMIPVYKKVQASPNKHRANPILLQLRVC